MRFFASFEETEPLPVLVVGAQVETKEVSLVLDELVELARNELSRADKFGLDRAITYKKEIHTIWVGSTPEGPVVDEPSAISCAFKAVSGSNDSISFALDIS